MELQLTEEQQVLWDSMEEEERKLIVDTIERIKEVWSAVVKWVRENVIPVIVKFARKLYNAPGYKRMNKMDGIRYYETLSEGKSNNWRKAVTAKIKLTYFAH